jgi:hypothetical protein
LEPITEEQRDAFFTSYQREAIHLEMRDVYATNIEADRFSRWMKGETLDPQEEAEWWAPWFALMEANRKAGKTMRRLRIVSEPVTDYIRFEWLDTDRLVTTGEEVRWLPRQKASNLIMPVNDFWLFDGEVITFAHFSGDGHVLGHEMTRDQDIIARCRAAFDAAWEIGTPHGQYRPA